MNYSCANGGAANENPRKQLGRRAGEGFGAPHGVAADGRAWVRGVDTILSALAARVAVCSSAWTDLVPGTGAVAYQEGRAAGCLA